MIATTNMPTTRNNEQTNTSFQRNFILMLKFIYTLTIIIKEVVT